MPNYELKAMGLDDEDRLLDEIDAYFESTGANPNDPTELKRAKAIAMLKNLLPNMPKPKVDMKYDSTGRNIEALTSGVGGALAGAQGGAAVGGPMGALAGGMAGAGIGAGSSYIGNALMDRQGEAGSYNRILDILGPVLGGALAKVSKLGPTAKSVVNTAGDAGLAGGADVLDTQAGYEGKSPVARTLLTAGLGGAGIPLARQAEKHLANQTLAGKTTETLSADAERTNQILRESLQYMRRGGKPIAEKPIGSEGFNTAAETLFGPKQGPAQRPALPDVIKNSPELKKFVKDNPEQLYEYVLAPITGAKTQAELKTNISQFAERLRGIEVLGGDKSASDIAQGLRSTFFNSLAKTNNNQRLANPDSFKLRLEAMGPEVTNKIIGKGSYEELSKLAESASKAGALGRIAVKFGDNSLTIAKHVPLDKDASLTPMAGAAGKIASMLSVPATGGSGVAAAAGIQGYEVYKIGLDKLLGNKNKKTLEALSSGLQYSSSDFVLNKFTEWLEEYADEKFKM